MSKEKAEKAEDKENATWKDKLTKKLKQFKKTRWFPLTVALLIIGSGIIIAFLLGFRITYAPELENSWDAISGVAAWVGVIVSILSAVASFMAVWYAIRVADKQNKIALFEKRYICYTTIQDFLVCANQMKELNGDKGIQTCFRVYMDDPEDITKDINASVLAAKLKSKQMTVISGEFLFSNYSSEIPQQIIDKGMDLIFATASSNDKEIGAILSSKARKLKQEYCDLCELFEKTTLHQWNRNCN